MHDDYAGQRIDEVKTWIKESTFEDERRPDVVLVMIGTNDVAANYEVYDAPLKLRSLLQVCNICKCNKK